MIQQRPGTEIPYDPDLVPLDPPATNPDRYEAQCGRAILGYFDPTATVDESASVFIRSLLCATSVDLPRLLATFPEWERAYLLFMSREGGPEALAVWLDGGAMELETWMEQRNDDADRH